MGHPTMIYAPLISDESSTYFEQADVYKNSELYNLGNDSDDDDPDDSGSFEKLKKKMKPIAGDSGGGECIV